MQKQSRPDTRHVGRPSEPGAEHSTTALVACFAAASCHADQMQ